MVVVVVIMVVMVGSLESNRGDLIASGRFLNKSITSRNPGTIGLSPSSDCSSLKPVEEMIKQHMCGHILSSLDSPHADRRQSLLIIII